MADFLQRCVFAVKAKFDAADFLILFLCLQHCKMTIREIVSFLETIAPPSLQEGYDNAGLLTGNGDWPCTGVVCALDATAEVIEEAIQKGANCVVAHHPIIFGGIKQISAHQYVGRALIAAIKHDIAIYAIHTNLDNILSGVNGKMADLLALENRQVLLPKAGQLMKLFCFVPHPHLEKLRSALFAAGAGQLGQYSECCFVTEGTGSFKPGESAKPFVGEIGKRHEEKESRLEVIFPTHLKSAVLKAMYENHPYEEVAFDLVALANDHPALGSGVVGDLPAKMDAKDFLALVKTRFSLPVIRHTPLLADPISRVALCGGAGSFLISKALNAGAQAFITADLKYHEFFDCQGRMLIADIGHYESEQFTIDLLQQVLQQKFRNFAVLKTGVRTNPITYYF